MTIISKRWVGSAMYTRALSNDPSSVQCVAERIKR